MSDQHPSLAFWDSADASDIGRHRKRNEDAVARLQAHGVFCIADGMGGENAGDVASQAVVRELKDAVLALADEPVPMSVESMCQTLEQALSDAGEWIRKRAEQQGQGVSGTTVVVLALDTLSPGRAMALHAGDSRLYRLRKRELTRLTRDHSILEESGLPKKKLPRMFHGMVTRAIGISDDTKLERTEVEVREGDLFLLCSDGLTGLLSDRKIRRLLLKYAHAPLDDTVASLVAGANEAGGHDNISVILVRVGPFPAA